MQEGKYVILCVDDDPDVLDWMQVVLGPKGYKVIGAANAEEGLRKFKSTQPDLIILDLMMEEIDSGTSLVKELKVSGNKAPVFLLSSAGDDLAVTTDFSALGLDGVFQKPLDPDLLLKVLKEKLG